jgi:aminopeptidase
VITRAAAAENEDLLLGMLATENASRVGEFSLTDAWLSPISHFMAETLFDENMGGPFGLGAPRLQRLGHPDRHRLDHGP